MTTTKLTGWDSASNQTSGDKVNLLLASTVIFFSPMNFLRHPDFYITLSDVFTFSCLFYMLARRMVPSHPFGAGTTMWVFGLILLIGGLLISSILNGSAWRGLVVSAQYFVSYFVIAIIILQRPRWQVDTLIRVFVLSIFIMCLHGIYLIYIDGETGTRFVSGNGRLMSFVERENECAFLLVATLPLLFFLAGTRQIRLATFWICFCLFGYAVLLTGSSTGFLGMVYVCGSYLLLTSTTSVLSFTRRVVGALVLVGLLIGLVGILGTDVLPDVFEKRVYGALESGDIHQAGTFSHRYSLILESFETVGDSIFLGLGADQYRVQSEWDQPVHNAYLLIWSEGGVFAWLGFLLIIIAGLWVTLANRAEADRRVTIACTFSAVSTFSILIAALPHVYGRFLTVPLFLALAVSLAPRSSSSQATV